SGIMGFINWIKEVFGFGDDDFDDIELNFTSESAESLMQSLANVSKKRRTLNMNDKAQREQYVREYCDMMAVASKDVEAQKVEYQQVTERLADLEEIDKLPVTDKSQVRIRANKIIKIEQEDSNYTRPAKKITEAQYRDMERLSPDIPEILAKMKEDEEYQMRVRRDLNLLEGEKGAVAYQRKEERGKARTAKNIAFTSIFAAVMAAALMFVLNQAMHVKVDLGWIILAGAFAVALTASFVMYQNAQSGIASANRKLSKAISVQNTVKIKYVNITNVLDYNYAKYKVMNSYELAYIWEKYKEEKEAREHDSDISERLEEARSDLYRILKHYHINDPSVWVYQPGVLVYDEEAKDIRKQLIVQRQRLKKGIDFEMYNLETAKKELEGLVREYPKYAEDIIEIVGEYE
ncbi:MAG: hypothetical protein J5574_01205, partial [Lachnospiraceae bacterium]|nr:hypothetical protein [Lachnospiraceae bacterium]